ncbi:methyl-accepting chemotaxis protein [Chromobacterium sp. IIBBL 290-4]|uniref:methyl-accepting chemotaxis protein n=1 Tax=Chromobacterium sp. IIBBL 290-4 TaxID=2953890 RepID=UPI0020B84035|nr:methyl-accepting chemotaxis protein [Chromobacterium sp. IIBBL 290-4]UTH74547.1 methyl-accepting chemotaxis protein [Chromobacterium sp. IIBBL 290-4]
MSIQAITEWFIPDTVRQAPEQAIRARTVVGVGLLAGLMAPLFAVEYLMLGHYPMAEGIALGGLGLLCGPFLLRLSGAVRLTAEFITSCMYAMVCWMVFVNGGILSTSLMWFAAIPFTAVFIGTRRSGMFWLAMSLAAVGAVMWLSGIAAIPPTPLPREELPKLQAKSLAGLSLVVLVLALAFDKAKAKSFEKLETARQDAERASQALAQMMEQISLSIRDASGASRQIAASTGSMAKTMAEQQERSEDMVVVAQQMAVVTSQNAEQSTTATQLAQTAGGAAQEGGKAMDQAVGQLGRAGEVIGHAAGKLEELGQRSAEVSGIVQLIRDIADQTNLLALNAAIEAARAGEMGRGFAVVADEVRKLAERTQNATQDIETKIKLIVDGTNLAIVAMRDGNQQMQAGRDHAQNAQSKLSGIIRETSQLAGLLDQVSQAESNQNQGFAQFAGDIVAVGESTRSLSGETRNIAEAIRQLDEQMDKLHQAVSRQDALSSSSAIPRPAYH